MSLPVSTVPQLFDALLRLDPARPRLTWYGGQGERIELSARVLGNWVAKTANLLVEEFDAGPGATVQLELPAAHWKTLAIGLAVSAVGADVVADSGEIRVAGDGADADLLVALPSLARRYEGELGRAVDYAAVITGYDDVFLPTSPDLTLIERAGSAFQPDDGTRQLIPDDDPQPLLRLVSVLLTDGSLVIAPQDGELVRRAGQENAVLG